MSEKSKKMEERLTHYRHMVQQLCDPQVASAFAEGLRKNLCTGKSDSHVNSYTASTSSSSSLSSSRTEPDNKIAQMFLITPNFWCLLIRDIRKLR
ncbi:unnamed protein product [Trichobilharzia szidati]|nr:unnamed protein product [Trichobilharzia szidati]